jgi:SAM-dependent methyltransferase
MTDSPVMTEFDARTYWEQRLDEDWSLTGVGFRRMGDRFNQLAYQRRGERFDDLVAEFLPNVHDARVLDVGSGTGFYLDRWRHVGAAEVVGLDLTEAAVGKLRERFPDLTIELGDITDGVATLAPESFDVISAMDVLFHIVDHERFARALRSIAALLKPGGVFVWSDLFLHGPEMVDRHIAIRSLYRIEALLDAADLEIVARRPMFFFMNEPRDTNSRLVWHSWRAMMGLAALAEPVADLVGRAAYRLDNWLDGRRTESPSTEFMVCVKKAS